MKKLSIILFVALAMMTGCESHPVIQSGKYQVTSIDDRLLLHKHRYKCELNFTFYISTDSIHSIGDTVLIGY